MMTNSERALLLESIEDLADALNALDNHLLGDDGEAMAARLVERVMGRLEGLALGDEEDED